MATNSQLSTTECKEKKKQKQTKQTTRETILEMDITWRVISGEGKGENEGKGTGNKKHKL